MHVLIAGDSWGMGEWNVDTSDILHPGLQHYFEQDNNSVTNISGCGISNLDIAHRIARYLENPVYDLPDYIVVFQTEYSRDFKHAKMQQDFGSQDWLGLSSVRELASKWIERFYLRLSEMSQAHNVPIKIVGGCSDTMRFDDMQKDYPGCDIACQSMTNLLLTGIHTLEDPVFSWYTKTSQSLIEKIKTTIPWENISGLLTEVDKGFARQNLLAENPNWFWPDGKHPNRAGHDILYQHLKVIFEKSV
jgi:hypothetical protein